MKTKLLGVVAACVLALTVGAANADTFFVNGTFGPGVDHSACGDIFHSCNYSWTSGGTLSGTVAINNGNMTAADLTVNINSTGTSPLTATTFFVPSNAIGDHFVSTNGTTSFRDGSCSQSCAIFSFAVANSLISFSYEFDDDVDVGHCSFFTAGKLCAISVTWSGTGTLTTPLPTALPLFATGLGALGLLGWRRKRKARAVV